MLQRNKAKKTLGFTLVELLLVVAILGTISAIAIPSFVGQRKRARIIGDAKTNANIIRMAMDTRRAETGIYGAANDYEYNIQSDGSYTRPTPDIIPSFTPKGNSKMSYKITIKEGGLAYDLEVSEGGKLVVTADQNGDVQEVKK